MTFENDGIQMKVCCPSGKEIPQCDSESIEINDMIDLLLKVLKSLEDVGKFDIGYFMENSSALCPGSASVFFDPLKSKVNCVVPNGLYV